VAGLVVRVRAGAAVTCAGRPQLRAGGGQGNLLRGMGLAGRMKRGRPLTSSILGGLDPA